MASALDLALHLIAQGVAPVPVAFRGKAPTDPRTGKPLVAWGDLRLTTETAPDWFNGKPQNVGAILGEPSNWLVDVDLDCPEAIALAPVFLPRTTTFGRASARSSHWLYRAEGARTRQFKDPTRTGETEKGTIVELRSSGGQTVFPGSVHPSGEPIEWHEPNALANVAAPDLARAVADLAAASILKRHTPDEAKSALARALLGCGWSRERVEAVCGLLGPVAAVADDFADLEPRLNETGRRALRKAKAWLGKPEQPEAPKVTSPDDEPAWLRAISQQQREDTAANYVKGIPFEGNNDGSRQLISKAAMVCCGFACGVEGGFRVLRDAPFAVRHDDSRIRRAVADVVREQKNGWGYKYEAEKLAERVPAPAAAEPASPRAWLSLEARLRATHRTGVRIATGLPTLDAATRGGIPARKLVVFGGAPGAAKTGTVTSIAHRTASSGIPVAILAADEDADALLTRFGQIEGFDRSKIEDRDPATVAALAPRLAALPLLLVDADEDDASLEDVAAELARRAAGGPALLVCDSLQRIRAKGSNEAKTPRERVDCIVAALKRETKRYGFVTFATSELSRGSYRSKDSSEQIDDLAAFKESGGVEYGVSVALVMRSRPGTPNMVDVAMPKNRLGPKLGFALRWDFDRATASESTEAPPDALGGTKLAVLMAENEDTGGLLLATPQSKRAIHKAVGGNQARVYRAIEELLSEGRLVRSSDGKHQIPRDGISST